MTQETLPFPQTGAGPTAPAAAPPRLWRARVGALAASRALVPLWLALVLFCGAAFRFTGLDWDQGQHLHPDERFLTMVETALKWPDNFLTSYFDEARSTLNPRNVGHTFFVYGDFPIILVKWISLRVDQAGYDEVHLVGRTVATLVDLATVLMVFLLGRSLYRSERVGLLGALLYASSALAIQQAHFFVVDNFSTFFATAALFFMVRVVRGGELRDYLLAGGAIGLALASKVSVYSLVVVMALAGAVRAYRAWQTPGVDRRASLERIALHLIASGVVAVVAFRLFQPYAFQGPSVFDVGISRRWLENLAEARGWVSGDRDAPFAHQWTDRTPILFPLGNMLLWGFGLPLGLAAWAGWGVAAWQLVWRRRLIHLVPVAWVAILFWLMGTQWVKSMRYLLPIYPTLALLAAWLLIWLWDAARRPSPASTSQLAPNLPKEPALGLWKVPRFDRLAWSPVWPGALLAVVVLSTLVYAAGFTSIYTRPHTRVEASRWIYANVPRGAVVANETQWDDGLPLRLDGKDGFGGLYTGLNLDITAEESPKKLQQVLDTLDRAEYLFISSNRQYDSLVRLPMRFPLAVAYYQALFGGELGFERVAEFTSYPTVLGIPLPDQGAEEAWTVYDHPRVQIFKKTPAYSRAQIEALLGNVNWDAIVQLWPKQAAQAPNALLLSPALQQTYQAQGTWSAMFDPDSLANRLPVVFWGFALVLVGLLGLPYVWLAARPLPDRGFALARPLGLLLVAWLVWWLASLRLATFTVGSIGLAVLLVGAGGLAIGFTRRVELLNWLRAHRRLVLIEEALFWGAFLLFVLIRRANPDLWHPFLGGEKPMDFAYLNAVIKSAYFPPYDPWFAGGYINYYYFGFVLVAVVTKLSGVVPAVAYNLAIATFFACLTLAAFGAALALITPVRSMGVQRRAVLFGLLGSLFVAVIGNLRELSLLFEGFQNLSKLEPRTNLPLLAGLLRTVDGFLFGYLAGKPLPFRQEWWYWNATRVIQHPPSEAGPITELPWFTYLFADLHAHAMALPYTVVAIALALAIVRTSRDHEPRYEGLLRLGLLALVIGALWPMNTWDFPTYALLTLAALLLSRWRDAARLSSTVLLGAAWRWGLMLVAAYALFLPFHRAYGSAASGIERWTGSQTPLGDYLTIHGFFLFAIAGALLTDFWLGRDLNPLARVLRLSLRRWYRLPEIVTHQRRLMGSLLPYWVGLYALGLALLAAAALAVLGKLAPAIIVLLIAITGLLFFRDASRSPLRTRPDQPVLWQMALVMIFAGLGLTFAVEFVVLKNIDISRMNTVFKFYLQVWVLWALAAAFAAASVYERLGRVRPIWREVWHWGFVALFGATLIYPVLATTGRVADRFERVTAPTLDGMSFMDRAVHRDKDQSMELVWDEEAIRWMQEHVEGSPVIAEANTAPTLYGWGNRFSNFTGNPSVIGWDWHQRQQRAVVPGQMISKRIEDIQQAYSSRSPQQAYRAFSRYGVQYFVVGQLERAYFPGGMDKWEQQSGILWEPVYENPGVKIYRLLAPTATASR